MKLVLYYSYSGNGEYLKEYFKDKGYDIVKIETVKRYPKIFWLMILCGGFEAMKHVKARIKPLDIDVEKYEEIVLISPIWADNLSSPINTVLDSFDFHNKKVTFILNTGSGTCTLAKESIKQLYEDATIIELQDPKKNHDEVAKLNAYEW